MTKIDIYSGFLGAGKTTLIKKMIKEAYAGEKVVLIENEFGEIGIDSGFLQDAGIEITEMNSGCICCSLVGDFKEALGKVLIEYTPDRIIIEPSGVGKLSDVINAVSGVESDNVKINCRTAVVDANKCKMYMKNFGEFFNNQIENASVIILSHTDVAKPGRAEEAVALIREHNDSAVIVSTDWQKLKGTEILNAMESGDTLKSAIKELEEEHHHKHHKHCECGCHEHEHHHHEHDEHCECGCHDHKHHHHHADEVFQSFGKETVKKFTKEEIEGALEAFTEDDEYGTILRAKGIVEATDGRFIHFDYVPGEADVRYGTATACGRLCVIGAGLNKEKIEKLFGV